MAIIHDRLATNICFVANFHKTFLFHEIAKKLAPNGIAIFWIVTKLDQYNFLKESYPVENILYLNRSYVKNENPVLDDFKINELVFGDRVLKHEIENGINFLSNIQTPLYNFLDKNKIRFVFGEITWAHEILLLRITKKRPELNCIYLQCSVVRIPNNRFGFFINEAEYDLMDFEQPFPSNEIIKLEKPKYLQLNDKIVSKNKSLLGRLNRLSRFFTGENIEKNDPNVVINKLTRFKIAAAEEFNKSAYRFVKRVDFDQIENDNFIFYGFHKQPESSIDVIGRYYEDQFAIIINLWRLLPPGWKIVVKEHTNAIGDRSYAFYKKLLKYPNLVIVNEKTDSRMLIDKSKLVASVSGTLAYEAALLKKPAITFSKVFFNRINYCKFISLDDLVNYASLSDLIFELNSREDNRQEFSNFLLKNTFEGYISDFVTDPTVMDDTNIQKICFAFHELIRCHGLKVAEVE